MCDAASARRIVCFIVPLLYRRRRHLHHLTCIPQEQGLFEVELRRREEGRAGEKGTI